MAITERTCRACGETYRLGVNGMCASCADEFIPLWRTWTQD